MEKKSIKKNIFMNMVLTISNFAFPLLTYTYVARVLTPAGTGKVAFASSIVSYFLYFAVLGVPAYGRRECAKLQDHKQKLSQLVNELLAINTITMLIAYAALFVTMLFVPKIAEYKLLITVLSCQIILKVIGVEWFFEGMEEYAYITKRSLLFKCISVVLTFVLVRSAEDVIWYGFVTIFTTSASHVCNFYNLQKYIVRTKVSLRQLGKHIKPILTLFAATIAITIYTNFDVSMLGVISNDWEVGLYNAAFKIETIVLSVSTAITTVLIPRMAYYFQTKQWQLIKQLVCKSICVSLLIAFPLVLYIAVFAENVLIFIGGLEYIHAVNTLRIKLLCIIPLTFTNLFGVQLLVPMQQERRYTQSVTIGLFVNLFMNALLIPKLGAVGAALGTLATEVWNMWWMGLGTKEYAVHIFRNVPFGKYIIPMAASALVSYVVGRFVLTLSVFWQLSITTIVYFGLYYTCLLITKETLIRELTGKLLKKFVREK